MSKAKEIEIPAGINIIKEVSNEASYQNQELAKIKRKAIV